MGKLRTPEDVQSQIDNIFGVGLITLDKTTYKNTHTKAKFIDREYGEWWTSPLSVLKKKGNPTRGHISGALLHKLSLDEVTKKLQLLFGDVVSIDQTSYVTASKKARFIDKEYGEWWAKPKWVLQGHGHKQRGYANMTKYNFNGKSLTAWCEENKVPYSVVQQNIVSYGFDSALNYVCSRFKDGEYTKNKTVLESKFIDLFKDIFPNIQLYNKKVTEFLSSFKPDFKLENLGKILYIDLHGLWWHCENNKDQNYHYNKGLEFSKNNICFLQFFEDEIQDKSNIVKSMILNRLGITKYKFFARKLELKSVSTIEARKFFEQNHLMGYKKSVCIGLYNQDELVCCLSYKNNTKNNYIEIARFATNLNTSCVGGFGRLVAYLKQFNKPIVSYCDLRYANGHSYEALGFKNVGETLGWHWTDRKNRYNRLMCKAGNGKTEKENAAEKKWYKIYDAGQRKYILKV